MEGSEERWRGAKRVERGERERRGRDEEERRDGMFINNLGCQQTMADHKSLAFWQYVANKYNNR
jgi:hypothetical protein